MSIRIQNSGIALRGESNNFGVVVRSDVRTFQQSDYLGGSVLFPISTLNDHLDALANLIL